MTSSSSSSSSNSRSGYDIKSRFSRRKSLISLVISLVIIQVTVLVQYRLPLSVTPWNTETLHLPPVLDTAMLPPQPSSQLKKKLVVFNALGRREAIQYSWFHKRQHFADWDCIAFLYVNETSVPEDDFHLMQLQQTTDNDSTACTVIRTPSVAWCCGKIRKR